jgi:hypothetical protein
MGFSRDLEMGNRYCNGYIQYLREKYPDANIVNLSDNKEYQSKDIDFSIEREFSFKLVEFKADTKISKTGNLYLEIVSSLLSGTKGWFLYCEADVLVYMDTVNLLLYKIDRMELKKLIINEMNTFKVTKAMTYNKVNNSCSLGILVPISFLKKHNIVKEECIDGRYF